MQGQIDLQKEVLTLRQENAYLKEELVQLKRMIFAGRRERFIPSDTTQHALFAEQKAVPVLEEIEKWMKEESCKVLPKSPLGKAINYALPRWKGLSAYAQHGQIEIDNNLVENAIRPLAVGRKNYLFSGSHDAAQMTAAMYSFMATCKKNNVNELEWLSEVMDRVQDINHKDLYQLIPNNWETYKLKQ